MLGSSEVLVGDEEASPAKYQPATEDRPLRGPVMGTSATLSGTLKKPWESNVRLLTEPERTVRTNGGGWVVIGVLGPETNEDEEVTGTGGICLPVAEGY